MADAMGTEISGEITSTEDAEARDSEEEDEEEDAEEVIRPGRMSWKDNEEVEMKILAAITKQLEEGNINPFKVMVGNLSTARQTKLRSS